MEINRILDCLDKVRSTGAGKWIACCPVHGDKTPSLAIRDTGDRILLYCFAGCTVADVCAAIGIGVHDLFSDGKASQEIIPSASRRDLIDTLLTESLIIEIAEADRAAGRSISMTDAEREKLARQFMRSASGVANG